MATSKNFISFFLISLLSTIIFIWYLIYQGFPGGAVGMAPFLEESEDHKPCV